MRSLLAVAAGAALCCAGPRVRDRELPSALAVNPADVVEEAWTPKEPRLERFSLPAGLEVNLLPEEGSEVVRLGVVIGCGWRDEPPGRPGLLGVLLRVLLEGGAGERSAAAQQLAMAKVLWARASLEDGESRLLFTIRRAALDEAIALVADLLRRPSLDEPTLRRVVDAQAKLLVDENSRLAVATSRARLRALYGDAAPARLVATPDSLSALGREDLAQQLARCVHPGNLTLALSGSVEVEAARRALAPLADWPPGEAPARVAVRPVETARRVFLVPAPGEPRVTVEVLAPGLPAGTPLRAAAEVLEGELEGWMHFQLRTRSGLIYSAEFDVGVAPASGMTRLAFTTRRELAWEAARQLVALVEQCWNRWPFDDEALVQLKDDAIQSHLSRSALAIVLDVASARRHGAEAPTVADLKAVTMEQVLQTFTDTLRPGSLRLVISGDVPMDAPWAKLGEVVSVDAAGSAPSARP